MKKILPVLLAFTAWTALAAETVTVRGSTTLFPVVQFLAEAFMEEHPEAIVSASSGGSGVGIAALIDGVCDVASSSRELKPEEWRRAVEKGIYPFHWLVAFDGLAVIVHPSNPLDRLTLDQVRDIFLGRITNWQELGGPDLPMVPVSRDTASGTYESFKELALGKADPAAPRLLFVASSGAMVETVRTTPGAIGYVGIGYLNPQVKALELSTDGVNFVRPSEEAVHNFSYPLARPLYLITNGFPKGLILKFILFAISAEGQSIVERAGFIPVR